MNDKKGKNTKTNKQNKQKPKEIPGCLSFGKMDLIYKIEFVEKDLEKPEEEVKNDENGEKYYNIENFNSIADLKFMKEKKNIWDKIVLKPNNATLEQLLVANKMSKKKMNVEYIGYGIPKFENDDEFFKEIFNYVNEKNHLCLNEKALVEDGSYSLTFEFSFKKKTHSFCISSGGENKEEKKEENNEEKKEENKEEGNEEKPKEEEKKEEGTEEKPKEEENVENKEENKEANKEEKEKKEEKEEPDEYEPNDAMKEEKIPKFSRKDSVLCNLNPKNKKYSLFYLNFDELKDIPGNFEKKDLIELIYFLKKKGAKIFINFYKPVEEEIVEEEDDSNKNQDNEIAGETYDSSGKINEKERQRKKEAKEEQDDESKEEKEMKNLNNLYYLTDLYFFDFKQALEEFTKHYKFFTSDKTEKSINKQKLMDYFISGIASGTKKEVDGDKYGFFLEDFMKYYVIHANKKKAKKNEFDCQLFPKINHNNINVINAYKEVIKKNVNNYVSIFVTFIICGVASNGSVSNEVIIGAFLNALEIVKRKLECEKNNINLSEKELMKFKLSEKNLADRIKELNLENQEGDFVLDCTNKEKSELKEYVPLYDYHLVYYFRSDVNQKELKKKGFIDDKGFIMYDPVHRKRMRTDLVNKKLNKEETQKKVESNIMNIDIASRMKDKEIDSSKINKDNNMTTIKKLPKSKYGIAKKKEKTKKKKDQKDKNDQSGEASGSGSDNEEEKDQKNEENKQEENKNEEAKNEEIQETPA